MAREQIVDRLPAAAVRHLLQLNAGDLREPLHRHMLRGSESTPGRVGQTRLFFRQGNQFGERVDAKRRVGRQHDGLT